jgi:anti-sigma factor RsiW
LDCVDIADRLLEAEPGNDPELELHVAGCPRCAQLARGLRRLDVVLSSAVVVEPPVELQHTLARLVREAAQPRPQPWWQRLPDIGRWLTERPQLAAAQGLAAIMLALASWQLFGWVSAFQPVVGNVGYALELVAASPAVAYVGNVQIDVQSLGLWSIVGIVGWLISENGVIGRRIASLGLRWP